MCKDARQWARACEQCQKAKVHRHIRSPLQQFEKVGRFQHLHVDIVGPLLPSHGKQYTLTMIDRVTKWPEAVPISNISATTIAEVLVKQWISRFGTPVTITTDQGRQFESDLFKKLAEFLTTKKNRTTAYHPQANGQVERWHSVLKAAITAHTSVNWVPVLQMIMLGLRTTIISDLRVSPAQLVYGQALKLPGDFFGEAKPDKNTADPPSLV